MKHIHWKWSICICVTWQVCQSIPKKDVRWSDDDEVFIKILFCQLFLVVKWSPVTYLQNVEFLQPYLFNSFFDHSKLQFAVRQPAVHLNCNEFMFYQFRQSRFRSWLVSLFTLWEKSGKRRKQEESNSTWAFASHYDCTFARQDGCKSSRTQYNKY